MDQRIESFLADVLALRHALGDLLDGFVLTVLIAVVIGTIYYATRLVKELRRFPPPWSVEETDACFIVRDRNGQALAYVYCEDEPGRRSAAHLVTRDEARRIAVNIAKLAGTAR
jgi:hypothetical protein